MSVQRPVIRILAAFVIMLAAAPGSAGDFVDTRVTFTVADDDILKGPEESTTASTSIPNAQPSESNRLFFDDYEKRDTGFENLSHLVLYAHQPGFFAGLDTEAAMVLRVQTLEEKGVALRDDGSYLKLTQDLGGDTKLALTAFPISADRFRLGYSYDISWGGSAIFKTTVAAPGARLELTSPRGYAFLGGKSGLEKVRMPDGTIEEDTVYGILGGGGVDVLDELRLEAGGGFFHRGIIDKEELKLVDLDTGRIKTARWDAFGGSAQLVYHVGQPIGMPVDFRLYKNDPLYREQFFSREKYDGGVSFAVQTEASVLGQTLQDPDTPNSTLIQWAMAADLSARIKIDRLRLHALAVYRDLAYILFNVPSLSPYVDLPSGVTPQPEYFVSGGFDYFIESAHLTPGVIVGVQRPAHVTTAAPVIQNATNDLSGQQTIVVRSSSDFQPMDPGDEVGLIVAAKLSARFDLSEAMGAIGELQLSHDPNRRRLSQDPTGIATYEAEDPEIIGFNIMLVAKF